jgi:regulator of protease activity HflC (stomatin/prohibitin superfamily)
MSTERNIKVASGFVMLFVLLALTMAAIWLTVVSARAANGLGIGTGAFAIVVLLTMWCGFFTLEPNQAAVMNLFGRYVGTARDAGLRWTNPFYTKKKISLRVRNFESGRLKVNDLEGSPIEIATVVVWQVVDTFEATFHVDNYEDFVHIQSESALRQMATRYPYDQHEGVEIALRSHGDEIAEEVKREIQDRLSTAGVQVIEARISHLAYAQEIAQAMLQRQQAGAIIAARARIVEGAVGMVHLALEQLRAGGQIELDEERKAAMVSNLLVVLCSDRATQPVVNTGTLYSG